MVNATFAPISALPAPPISIPIGAMDPTNTPAGFPTGFPTGFLTGHHRRRDSDEEISPLAEQARYHQAWDGQQQQPTGPAPFRPVPRAPTAPGFTFQRPLNSRPIGPAMEGQTAGYLPANGSPAVRNATNRTANRPSTRSSTRIPARIPATSPASSVPVRPT